MQDAMQKLKLKLLKLDYIVTRWNGMPLLYELRHLPGTGCRSICVPLSFA